ncbi:uncharacterized protein PHACADRAFT_94093 [Phanerochaete carnosa HHB-10118-sp]|uniref:Ubiquitinyl hydrolase 1 n=1 Tax=Phanerochaete carnosa (strain HHB-10118-sp) TaxID=650164 RepID=K5W7J6_PHACS|nr:uncharacterized protein PHACADRAFT_94093 [Phanerochaete carnosa HHB-10118-sp]EKM55145.1 hypothetical protein PHACADRAFT_94093 [Phanerochaete carnosa HHB-10118-sp]
MPPKRPRRTSPATHGLHAGEKLKRTKLSGNEYLAWSWVGTEVTDAVDITSEHRLATCGLSKKNGHCFCVNKYAPATSHGPPIKEEPSKPLASGELEDDVIVVSDDELLICDAKTCKSNPNCLNYLGQERWQNEGKARDAFFRAVELGLDPTLDFRASGSPIGLKVRSLLLYTHSNLGATCYANAFLQVWYQDLPFRAGVYQCEPSPDKEDKFSESPIYQLQVTFAAMQMSKQAVFNPVRLVESLKLRATEQQDAQEFSKLFMAHLDSEFHKQPNPVLKSLVADQFQGKQVYTTVCSKCHTRSERESEFLELELTLANNAKLEDRLSASLAAEELQGDNQYLCSRCDSLQDAKRFTEIRELPPVLHFSLLRFVYDLSTMERKKSKHAVLFPETLEMDKFFGGGDHVGKKRKCSEGGKGIYYLRGVLLHRGASAYHGHYETQIFDMKNKAWYQFNDEVVTKLGSLRAPPKAMKKDELKSRKANDKARPSQVTPPRAGSDIEIVEYAVVLPLRKSLYLAVFMLTALHIDDANSYISSRDAYMLIYARAPDNMTGRPNGIPDPQPPPRALQVVEELNATHEKACEEYSDQEKAAEERFQQTRCMVMDIYRSWSLSHDDEDSVVCSKQALETWMSRHLTKPKDQKPEMINEGTLALYNRTIPNGDITCAHGRLDPKKAQNMKRLNRSAYDRMSTEGHCNFEPSFSPADVCPECVEEGFRDRIYSVEHPRLVSVFDEVAPVNEGDSAFWISKPWLKDWRSTKPKMHISSRPDPPPDDSEYTHHVKCEHGGLTPNVISRKRISPAAYELLKGVFPAWTTLSTDSDTCAVCEAMVQMSREDKRGAKIQAEDEKAKLRHMHDHALTGNNALLEEIPCALVPAPFIRAWRQWLFHPANERPESVDTRQFICEHGLLALDPNTPGDLDGVAAIISRDDWAVLETLYSCGPLIAIEHADGAWRHDPAVCKACRLKCKSAYEKTELTIRVLRADDPTPTPETYAEQLSQPAEARPTVVTYGSKKIGNLRQSKRIRQTRELGRRRKLIITPDMTVKDLKIQIQAELEIPTISQCLYYHGNELENSAMTLGSLGVLSNDTMDLREESEDIDLLGSGSDAEPTTRKKEGRGFGGTLLGYSSSSSPPHTPSQHADELPSNTTISCPACTYDNAADAFACLMCETMLDGAPE